MRSSIVLLVSGLLAAAAWADGPTVAMASRSPRADTLAPADVIDVEVLGLRNEKGQLSCVLYDRAEFFPRHPEHAVGGHRIDIRGSSVHCVFENVPRGTYAVVVHHDENNNHRVDTNFFGFPTEGFGMSRDPKPHLGPPGFDDAKFEFPGGVFHVTLHMQY